MTDPTAPVDDLVLVEESGPVRLVTFNRPDKLNAFNAQLYRQVAAALASARDADAVRAVVLTGAGRAFSAGQDLGEMTAVAKSQTQGDATDRAEATKRSFTSRDDASGFSALLDEVTSFDKPLLAAVNGIGIGIGATILPHCDLVVMAESARLRTPFAELGVTAEAGSTFLFPARLGWQRAAAMMLAGEWLSSQEAVDAGLAYRVVPDADVLDETLALARQVAAAPLAALRSIKGLLLAAQADHVRDARRAEEADFAALLSGLVGE